MLYGLYLVNGIQNLQSNLEAIIKPMGLIEFHPADIPKSCSTDVAPILEVIFKQSLNTRKLPSNWLTAKFCPVFIKGNRK